MRLSVITCFSVLFVLVSGCQIMQNNETKKPYIAEYTKEKIKVDGKLDEKIWKNAKNLSFQALDGSVCTENGVAKIIWDDKYIYVGAKLYDSDIVQESNENQVHLYSTGDLLEVFLKPNGRLNYWEFYSTPNNKKTSFLFELQGRLGLPNCFKHLMPGLLVTSTCNGTLNNLKGRDKYWTTEMAIPGAELEKHGGQIIPGKKMVIPRSPL